MQRASGVYHPFSIHSQPCPRWQQAAQLSTAPTYQVINDRWQGLDVVQHRLPALPRWQQAGSQLSTPTCRVINRVINDRWKQAVHNSTAQQAHLPGRQRQVAGS